MLIFHADEIQTPGGTVAVIDFNDGNQVYMNVGTRVQVGTIRLFFGEIYNLVLHIGAGGSTVYTNDLSAAADSTGFLVNRRDPARGSVVTVVQGAVRCSPPAGAPWTPVLVRANFQITATARSRTPAPMPVNAAALAQWVNAAAQRLRRKAVIPGTIIP
jgi:ferric-dicitrate binding protein FerR (iron transport regulator)